MDTRKELYTQRYWKSSTRLRELDRDYGDIEEVQDCIAELEANALHAPTASLRALSQAALKAHSEWERAEEEAAEPSALWFYDRIEEYAYTAPVSKRGAAILAKLRRFADAADTPKFTRRDVLQFLAAPDAWQSVAETRRTGAYG